MPTTERVWVIAVNDGEAAELLRLLVDHGERVLVSTQAWGASWEDLEPDIQRALDEFKGEIIGIELKGPNRWGASNIDHHRYDSEDRWHAESSLEQIADRLGIELTRWQKLVAANDRGYIPAMAAMGASAGEIAAVRLHDRRVQGVTPKEELEAKTNVAAAEWLADKAIVHCTGRCTSAHSDLLFGRARETLFCGAATWEYSGPRHREFAGLCNGEETWSGGTAESGYFGVAAPLEETKRKVMEHFRNG